MWRQFSVSCMHAGVNVIWSKWTIRVVMFDMMLWWDLDCLCYIYRGGSPVSQVSPPLLLWYSLHCCTFCTIIVLITNRLVVSFPLGPHGIVLRGSLQNMCLFSWRYTADAWWYCLQYAVQWVITPDRTNNPWVGRIIVMVIRIPLSDNVEVKVRLISCSVNICSQLLLLVLHCVMQDDMWRCVRFDPQPCFMQTEFAHLLYIYYGIYVNNCKLCIQPVNVIRCSALEAFCCAVHTWSCARMLISAC